MRMNPMRTACGVAQGIRRYTRAKTFTAIGWRWWWRVFRRSPVNLVCGRLCWSAPRVGFSGSRGTSSTTSRQLCEGWIDIRRGHHGDMGRLVVSSKQAGRYGDTASLHHQRKGSRLWGCDSLRCRIFDPYECFDGAHTSRHLRQPGCRCVLDTVRRCLQGGGRMADEVSHRVFMTDDGKRAVWERIRREARRCVSVVTNGELPGAAFRVPGIGGRA